MKLQRRDARRERKLAIGLVISSVLLVVLAVAASLYFSPENMATRELERMAKEYYETYLYGGSLATLEKGLDGFADFSEEGFQPVKLRQLLLYRGGKNRESQRLFESDEYWCSLDRTEVVYRPVAPYGVKDYTIEYRKQCKKTEV